MPRKYIRRSTRASWSEEDLQNAIQKISDKSLSINKASKAYNIPYRTLNRRLKANNLTKKTLGKHPSLGFENEQRLVNHIQRLQKAGFAPTSTMVRSIAYNFAKILGKEEIFGPRGAKEELAGRQWFRSFMERCPQLSLRKSEGLSVARARGMNRQDVQDFYKLLKDTLQKYNLENKPNRIFNLDETGIQLTNSPGKVVAKKGSKCVHVVTPKEKGETITLVVCINAEGTFLPPVLIMKGVRKANNRLNGLPPGSDLYMNKKSSYINGELFLKWFKEIFLPRKPQGYVLLILDGHTSHCNQVELLQIAEQNNVILLCLPSHTTQALQPLDRSCFKPLKEFYKQEAQNWLFTNKEKVINRDVVGGLIGRAWQRAATAQNAISGFQATGIYPFNDSAIPEYFFDISDNIRNQNIATNSVTTNDNNSNQDILADPVITEEFLENDNNYVFLFDNNHNADNLNNFSHDVGEDSTYPDSEVVISLPHSPVLEKNKEETLMDETPSKILHDVAPVPQIPTNSNCRNKQSAKILIQSVEVYKPKIATQETSGSLEEPRASTSKTEKSKKKSTKLKQTKKSKNDEDCVDCVECLVNYYNTTVKVDWIQCINCKNWLHEDCTMYGDLCNICGREEKRKNLLKRKTLDI